MSQERPWFKSYPQGVPHEVDLEQYRSIVSVFDEAISKYRDRPAFRNFGKTLTYGEIDKLSRQFAAYLLGELKLKKGDRVAIMMPNCLQYPIAIFGVLRAGLTVVNVNPMYTPRELKHQLVDSGASVLLVVDNFGKTAQEALAGTEVRQVITTALGDLVGFPKGAIVNFVLKYVKKMVPDYDITGAVRFKDTLTLGQLHALPDVDIDSGDSDEPGAPAVDSCIEIGRIEITPVDCDSPDALRVERVVTRLSACREDQVPVPWEEDEVLCVRPKS